MADDSTPGGPGGLFGLPGRSGPAAPGPLWLHPDDDLAPNRPGEHLHAKLAALVPERMEGQRRPARHGPRWLLRLGGRGRPGSSGRPGQPVRPGTAGGSEDRGWSGTAARLVGRPDSVGSWRRQLLGQQRVGEELERLTGGGWRVLHAVPLPGDATIPHLLLGPGGAFTVRTEYRGRARVSVGEDSVSGRRLPLPRPRRRPEPAAKSRPAEAERGAGRGWRAGRPRGGSEPSVRWSRREARRASLALSRAAGFAVEVCPVLVLVGASAIRVAPALRDVRVLSERAVGELAGGGAVWKPAEVEAVHAAARDRRTWAAV